MVSPYVFSSKHQYIQKQSGSKGYPQVSCTCIFLYLIETLKGQSQLHKHIYHNPKASLVYLVCTLIQSQLQGNQCLWRKRTNWRSWSLGFFLLYPFHWIDRSNAKFVRVCFGCYSPSKFDLNLLHNWCNMKWYLLPNCLFCFVYTCLFADHLVVPTWIMMISLT